MAKRVWAATGLAMAALAASPASSKPAQGTFTAQSSASETGEGEEATQHTVNTTFEFASLFPPESGDLVSVLFEQTVTSEYPAFSEAPSSELTVTARKRGAKGYDTVAWTLADNGNEGAYIGGDYYRTTLWGCCGAENTYRYYLAWTGKLAFAASTDPVFVEIPNATTRRAIGYLSANVIDGFDLEKWPNGGGLITYTDGDRVVDRLLLETEPGADYQWTPTLRLEGADGTEMNGDSLDLWAANGDPDPKGITGFSLVLDWEQQSGMIAKLPVVEDRFDLTAAELPEGLTVRRLDPGE